MTTSRSCVKTRLVQFEKTRREEGHMQPPTCLVVSNCASVGLMQRQKGWKAVRQKGKKAARPKGQKARRQDGMKPERPKDRKA